MNTLVVSAHPDDEAFGLGATIFKHTKQQDKVFLCILCQKVSARLNKPAESILKKQTKASAEILGVNNIFYYDFENIKMNTEPRLNIIRSIEEVIEKVKPEIVYTHSKSDLNIDHRIVFEATMVAIKLPERKTKKNLKSDLIKQVFCYEVLSSTEWKDSLSEPYKPNVFVDIEKEMEFKLRAVKQYKEAVKSFPHPRSIENIKTLAKYRGMQSGFKFAEAFELVKLLK
ncbi:PIG-L deacetylase family protein [Patescibacteria group bacterium]